MNYGTPEQSCYRKQRYSTEGKAMKVAVIRMITGSGPLSIYSCEICGGYHLTSKGIA